MSRLKLCICVCVCIGTRNCINICVAPKVTIELKVPTVKAQVLLLAMQVCNLLGSLLKLF